MDSSIFSGLESLGLGKLKDVDVFEKPANNNGSRKENEAEKKPVVMQEKDFLIDREYECVICSAKFKVRTMRTGKAKLIGSDLYLRAKYQDIEPLKYDVISCPDCGFTTLSRYFKPITAVQKKMIVDNISANFTGDKTYHETYTYEEAIGRYKLALINAVVRKAKNSEKAYICLKASWLCQSYKDSLNLNKEANNEKLTAIGKLEQEFDEKAYEGFTTAISQEQFPMCGMDEYTVEYIIASLAYKLGKYDVAAKSISGLIANRNAAARLKDKARDLKDELLKAVNKGAQS